MSCQAMFNYGMLGCVVLCYHVRLQRVVVCFMCFPLCVVTLILYSMELYRIILHYIST